MYFRARDVEHISGCVPSTAVIWGYKTFSMPPPPTTYVGLQPEPEMEWWRRQTTAAVVEHLLRTIQISCRAIACPGYTNSGCFHNQAGTTLPNYCVDGNAVSAYAQLVVFRDFLWPMSLRTRSSLMDRTRTDVLLTQRRSELPCAHILCAVRCFRQKETN